MLKDKQYDDRDAGTERIQANQLQETQLRRSNTYMDPCKRTSPRELLKPVKTACQDMKCAVK